MMNGIVMANKVRLTFANVVFSIPEAVSCDRYSRDLDGECVETVPLGLTECFNSPFCCTQRLMLPFYGVVGKFPLYKPNGVVFKRSPESALLIICLGAKS